MIDLRLQLISRCAVALRQNIERNGGRYTGSMAPNLQSVVDLCLLPPAELERVSAQLDRIEQTLAAGQRSFATIYERNTE